MPTRILLADDHPVVRSGLKAQLDEHPDLVVVAEVGDGAQLTDAVAAWRPDVLVLDVRMPNFDAVAATRHLCATYPDLHILILTGYNDDEYIHGLLEAGALGYVLKGEPPANLITAIRNVARGDPWLSSPIARLVAYRSLGHGSPADGPLASLTNREREILTLLVAGLNNRAIADRLVIAEKTVKNHIHSLYAKLGLTNRQQAVLFAIHHGLVDLRDSE